MLLGSFVLLSSFLTPPRETSRKGNRYDQFHIFVGSATGLLLSLRIPQAWGFGAQGSWDPREPWGPGGGWTWGSNVMNNDLCDTDLPYFGALLCS